MLLRIPEFYDSFHCIADKCTDTCCIGWEIDIDDASAKRYSSIEGDFGDTLRQNIENGHFKLRPGDRCPFLRQDGLCNMICHLGEESLCDICREHPRFVEVYGDIMEKGLGLCCEEAARLLLNANGSDTSPIAFIERKTDDVPDDIPDDAREARNTIFKERDLLFNILADHRRPLNERLVELLDFAVETSGIEIHEPSNSASDEPSNGINNEIDKNNIIQTNDIQHHWIGILGKGESFGPAWDAAYKRLAQCNEPNKSHNRTHKLVKAKHKPLFTDSDGEKIIAYLLFRYYGKSLFDGNSLTKVMFALYFWTMLRMFGGILANTPHADSETAKIDAIKLLSKQTEYSEEIMSLFETEFMENPSFSPLNFKRFMTKQTL